MATDLEREAVEKLSEAVDALSVNAARLSERLDAQRETTSAHMARLSENLEAQRETLTEAMRASQEETRRMVAEQNAAQAQEFHALIERLDDRINSRIDRVEERIDRIDDSFVRVEERIERVEGRLDHLSQRMDSQIASLSTMIYWVLGIVVSIGIAIAGLLIRILFGI